MSALWRDVSRAAWDDSGLCVEGSTGFATHGDQDAEQQPPKKNNGSTPDPRFVLEDGDWDWNAEAPGGIVDAPSPFPHTYSQIECTAI
ncbi:hypothetical protein QQX98_001365 [Neonectria punicea]|uniref:Uncharacterized protein n=1 Tax=Neonectria punicea TaxID=979145 RepID=A0ABR1HPB7_9HYPO